jgi:hypothetical protein
MGCVFNPRSEIRDPKLSLRRAPEGAAKCCTTMHPVRVLQVASSIQNPNSATRNRWRVAPSRALQTVARGCIRFPAVAWVFIPHHSEAQWLKSNCQRAGEIQV